MTNRYAYSVDDDLSRAGSSEWQPMPTHGALMWLEVIFHVLDTGAAETALSRLFWNVRWICWNALRQTWLELCECRIRTSGFVPRIDAVMTRWVELLRVHVFAPLVDVTSSRSSFWGRIASISSSPSPGRFLPRAPMLQDYASANKEHEYQSVTPSFKTHSC